VTRNADRAASSPPSSTRIGSTPSVGSTRSTFFAPGFALVAGLFTFEALALSDKETPRSGTESR